MSQQATVTLTDDTPTTPVNRAFLARGVQRSGEQIKATWQYIAGGIYAGFNTLTQSYRLPTATSDATRIEWKLVQPTLAETAPSTSTGYSPAPKAAYENQATLGFVFSSRSTTQERKDILKMVRDLIDEALMTEVVVDGNPVSN